MIQELSEIHQFLKDTLSKHVPPLQIRKDTDSVFEVAGTKEAMQGKQKVEGFYFGSVVPKPKDIRLYFFPIYTHTGAFSGISPSLRKCLKGKSCFHIKKLDEALQHDIIKMVDKGIGLYLEDNLI